MRAYSSVDHKDVFLCIIYVFINVGKCLVLIKNTLMSTKEAIIISI